MIQVADPLQSLSDREKALVAQLNQKSKSEIIERLHRDLQIAVEIELATLPIYMYTYYSINRLPTVASIDNEMKGVDERTALFANKAGATIMSVLVEEMLHMSLAANMLYALGKLPKLYRKSPEMQPNGTNLPHHQKLGPDGKPVAIKLEQFNLESMWAFLEIEYPKEYKDPLVDENWVTIGDFYSYIRCLICTDHISDEDFAGPAAFQLSDDYYAQNCIDTIYPNGKFNPSDVPMEKYSAAKAAEYANSGDAHAGQVELVKVINRTTALQAIATICDQGEGNSNVVVGEDGQYEIKVDATDDPSKAEQSHYYKFLALQSNLEGYDPEHEAVAPYPKAPAPVTPPIDISGFVKNYPLNPSTTSYPAQFQTLSNLCNAIYQYMLMMSEAAYTVSGSAQVELFNVGMHKAMIWVLDKLLLAMRDFTYDIDGTTYCLAPTFENLDITSNGLPAKRNVIAYAEQIVDLAAQEDEAQAGKSDSYTAQYKKLFDSNIILRLNELPDIALVQNNQDSFVPVEVKHACMGLNACKGQGRIIGDNGPNNCAGQGYCNTSVVHSCHTQNDCKQQGGCGLYGTTKEQSDPGGNACKGHGSCATPINAERFATAPGVAGKSVWRMARAAFEQRMKSEGKAFGNPPDDAYQKVNDEKVMVGPSNEFLNKNGCYSACGSSGMSGGGSCS